MRILIAESLAPGAVKLLQQQPGWEVIVSNPKEYMQHLAGADALTRLHLLQEQKDLLDERSRVDGVKDLSALEKQFIKVAKAYGERKGITYGTWRAAGVSAAVLQKAEISRARA